VETNNTKGIVCSTDEVRAILDGKSQFREAVNLSEIHEEVYQIVQQMSDGIHDLYSTDKEELAISLENRYGISKDIIFDKLNEHGEISEEKGQEIEDEICDIICIFLYKHQVGDILYVKEEFVRGIETIFYKTEGNIVGYTEDKRKVEINPPWEKAEDMPKEYARIFQKVTAIRVERLQDIEKRTDAFDEVYRAGLPLDFHEKGGQNFWNWFIEKWDSEHEDGEKWEDDTDKNPIYVIVEDRESVEL
jgi:hypothetical protein